MLFDKEKYKLSISTLESIALIKFFIIIAIFCIILIALNALIFKFEIIIPIIVALILGLLTSYTTYSIDNIKIEEMKMKLDIYEIIEKRNNNEN